MNDKIIEWLDYGREPQVAPDPAYPEGTDIDLTKGEERICKIDLPYPAKRIGVYSIICETCRLALMISTAGRPDDPRSVTIPCKARLQ